jgi:hypothetical protein
VVANLLTSATILVAIVLLIILGKIQPGASPYLSEESSPAIATVCEVSRGSVMSRFCQALDSARNHPQRTVRVDDDVQSTLFGIEIAIILKSVSGLISIGVYAVLYLCAHSNPAMTPPNGKQLSKLGVVAGIVLTMVVTSQIGAGKVDPGAVSITTDDVPIGLLDFSLNCDAVLFCCFAILMFAIDMGNFHRQESR